MIEFETKPVVCLNPEGENRRAVKLVVLTENPEPQELATLEPPFIDPSLGLILSGDMPDWLSVFLARHYTNYWMALSQSNTSAVVFGKRVNVPPSKSLPIGTLLTVFTVQTPPEEELLPVENTTEVVSPEEND